MADTWFAVPAGTKPSVCRGPRCGARIYWVTNARTQRAHCVDAEVAGGVHPSAPVDPRQLDAFGDLAAPHEGRGVSHQARCPDAALFCGYPEMETR